MFHVSSSIFSGYLLSTSFFVTQSKVAYFLLFSKLAWSSFEVQGLMKANQPIWQSLYRYHFPWGAWQINESLQVLKLFEKSTALVLDSRTHTKCWIVLPEADLSIVFWGVRWSMGALKILLTISINKRDQPSIRTHIKQPD